MNNFNMFSPLKNNNIPEHMRNYKLQNKIEIEKVKSRFLNFFYSVLGPD